MRHVAEDGEGDCAGQQARGCVHQAGDHRVPGDLVVKLDYHFIITIFSTERYRQSNVLCWRQHFVWLLDLDVWRLLDAVVVELVVAAQGGQGASADGVGKEDLRGGVDPTFGRVKFWPENVS